MALSGVLVSFRCIPSVLPVLDPRGRLRVGIVGGLNPPPQFMSTDAHF